MRYLIDSHILLWSLKNDHARLTPSVLTVLGDDTLWKYISMASLWEISIKASVGKLNIPSDFFDTLSLTGLKTLPIASAHLAMLLTLPLYHRDPFDRLLIAQAKIENMTLITADQKLAQYDIPTMLV